MRGFCPRGEEASVAMSRPRKYPPELLDRGARLVIESGRPIAHVASVFFATELDQDRTK